MKYWFMIRLAYNRINKLQIDHTLKYSKTPIYRASWGKGKSPEKSGHGKLGFYCIANTLELCNIYSYSWALMDHPTPCFANLGIGPSGLSPQKDLSVICILLNAAQKTHQYTVA
jgi:hypothetical protein